MQFANRNDAVGVSSAPSLPQIPAAIARLNAASLHLQAGLDQLQVRLHPITDLSGPVKTADSKVDSGPRVPLAAAIDEHTLLLERLGHEVDHLINTLEL